MVQVQVCTVWARQLNQLTIAVMELSSVFAVKPSASCDLDQLDQICNVNLS